MNSLWLRTVLGCCALPFATLVLAQQGPPTPSPAPQTTTTPSAATPATTQPPLLMEKPEQKLRRFSFGGRMRGMPQLVMHDGTLLRSTTTPQLTYNTRTNSSSPRVSIGPSLELTITKHISLAAEMFFNSISYTKTTDIYLGTYTSVDSLPPNQRPTTVTEHTSATWLDFPAMVRLNRLRSHGILSKLYLAGGASLRTTAFIQTTNETNNPDNSITSNKAPARPAKRNLFGKTAGIGFRLVDDVNLKVMPEVRYTIWSGRSFDSETTRSRSAQLEVSLGIIY